MFGALDDEDRAPIYWTNALVYLLPWLSRGFELDRFSVACLVAGVIHIQVRPTSKSTFDEIYPDRSAIVLLAGWSMAEEGSQPFYH